jgi:hypothetical protein
LTNHLGGNEEKNVFKVFQVYLKLNFKC